MLSARWAYMTNVLLACKRRPCLQMVAVIEGRLNCQKGGKLKGRWGERNIWTIIFAVTDNLRESEVILARYHSVLLLFNQLFVSCFHSKSELQGGNDLLMNQTLRLSCLGLLLHSDQDWRQGWDYMGNGLDREEGPVSHLWISWSLCCVALSASPLSVRSQVKTDAPLIRTLRAVLHFCVLLRLLFFPSEREIHLLNPGCLCMSTYCLHLVILSDNLLTPNPNP